METIKIKEEYREKLFDVISEIIKDNYKLRMHVKDLAYNKWSEFASKNKQVYEYLECFDDGDFQYHFGYSLELAEIEAHCDFVNELIEKIKP